MVGSKGKTMLGILQILTESPDHTSTFPDSETCHVQWYTLNPKPLNATILGMLILGGGRVYSWIKYQAPFVVGWCKERFSLTKL